MFAGILTIHDLAIVVIEIHWRLRHHGVMSETWHYESLCYAGNNYSGPLYSRADGKMIPSPDDSLGFSPSWSHSSKLIWKSITCHGYLELSHHCPWLKPHVVVSSCDGDCDYVLPGLVWAGGWPVMGTVNNIIKAGPPPLALGILTLL